MRLPAPPAALLCVFAGLALPVASKAETLLIHDAYVLTMDPAQADIPRGDILIRDGRIIGVGTDLAASAPQARRMDGEGQIVLPGFIDTHSHLYTTLMRGQFRNAEARFFPESTRLAAAMSAQDVGIAMTVGALQLLEGGITTTADYFDNIQSPAHAEAGWTGLQASGISGRMYYGGPDRSTRHPIDIAHLQRMAATHPADSPLQLGLAWRLPRDRTDAANWAMRQAEFDAAAAAGLPVQVHVSGEPEPIFQALVSGGYLRPGVTVVHATDARPEHLAALEAAGGSLSLTPLSEHRVGYGVTRVDHFAAVSRRGLGIDGNPLAGSADMYATLRHAALTWSGSAGDETAPDPRALLALATRDGARAMGLEAEVGMLRTGMRANLQIVDPRGLNLAGFGGGDPAALLVYDVRPDNVRTVIVDGRLVKHEGRMLHPRLDQLLQRADETARRLR